MRVAHMELDFSPRPIAEQQAEFADTLRRDLARILSADGDPNDAYRITRAIVYLSKLQEF